MTSFLISLYYYTLSGVSSHRLSSISCISLSDNLPTESWHSCWCWFSITPSPALHNLSKIASCRKAILSMVRGPGRRGSNIFGSSHALSPPPQLLLQTIRLSTQVSAAELLSSTISTTTWTPSLIVSLLISPTSRTSFFRDVFRRIAHQLGSFRPVKWWVMRAEADMPIEELLIPLHGWRDYQANQTTDLHLKQFNLRPQFPFWLCAEGGQCP